MSQFRFCRRAAMVFLTAAIVSVSVHPVLADPAAADSPKKRRRKTKGKRKSVPPKSPCCRRIRWFAPTWPTARMRSSGSMSIRRATPRMRRSSFSSIAASGQKAIRARRPTSRSFSTTTALFSSRPTIGCRRPSSIRHTSTTWPRPFAGSTTMPASLAVPAIKSC